MNAGDVAKVIGRIDGAMWLPRIASWEIAQTDSVWGAHGELDTSDAVPAVMALTRLATEVGSELTDATPRLMVVDFVHRAVPVRVWWLRPVVPVAHATGPVLLEELAQTEHELTGARLALWEEEQETARLRLAHASARRGRRGLRAWVAELEQQLAAARGVVAEALMCPDEDCNGHLPKIERALGGVDLLPAADRVVAYRSESGRSLRCVDCMPVDLTGFTAVRVSELPDGGICTHADCGRDVLTGGVE